VARGRFVVGLIGAGIGPSATPALHEAEADALGVRYAYQVIDIDEAGVPAEDVCTLVAAARRMGFRGLNITHPCKQYVVDCVDELSPEAAAIGAANTVVFTDDGSTIGHNTDIYGFEQSFKFGLSSAATDHVLVLGAGGAGAAVAYVLLELGARKLTIVDLDSVRAEALLGRLSVCFEHSFIDTAPIDRLADRLASCDGIVHATPVGMAQHPGMAFSPDLLRRELWVADVVYRPLQTELLRQAEEVGCRTLDGGGMAVFQAVRSFSLFTGLEPDPARMLQFFDRAYRTPDVAGDATAAALS
jgi:quinate/shikimate dehydrogenase (NAD+)